VGGALLYLGIFRANSLALGLVGGLLWVIGIARLGYYLRQWAARQDHHWAMLGALLLIPAMLLLIRIGVGPLMSFIIVGILFGLVLLVVWRGRSPVIVGTFLGLVLWMGFWLFSQPEDAAPTDPNPQSENVLVAMGDSFMSGEGSPAYLEGTNEHSVNECRRASSAYAYRVADQLDMSLAFLACSGARTDDIAEREQFAGIGRQIDQLREIKPRLGPGSVVLISVGGNNAGFGEIGRTCLVPGSCAVWGEQWLRSIRDQVERDITGVHRLIRLNVPEDVPIFATTYPVVLKEDSCLWSPFADDEHFFLATQLIIDLNDSVRRSAETAGINVIDLEGVLEDRQRRICDRVDPQQAAVNIIGLGPVQGTLWDRINPRTWFHGSLHPKPDGHDLFDEAVAQAIEEKREGISQGEPVNPEPRDPRDRRGTPFSRFGEDHESFTELPTPLVAEHGGACSTEFSATRSIGIFVDSSDVDETGARRVYGAEPGSNACQRDANGTWRELEVVSVGETGVIDVPWAFPQTYLAIQAFYHTEAGDVAVVEVVFCHVTPARCPGSGTSQWVGEQLRLLFLGVGLPVWALALIGSDLTIGSIGATKPQREDEGWRNQVLTGPASEPSL
jgi:hypothetical protein